eukprot:scaffold54641_cov63-Attheya_sp.AAC.3
MDQTMLLPSSSSSSSEVEDLLASKSLRTVPRRGRTELLVSSSNTMCDDSTLLAGNHGKRSSTPPLDAISKEFRFTEYDVMSNLSLGESAGSPFNSSSDNNNNKSKNNMTHQRTRNSQKPVMKYRSRTDPGNFQSNEKEKRLLGIPSMLKNRATTWNVHDEGKVDKPPMVRPQLTRESSSSRAVVDGVSVAAHEPTGTHHGSGTLAIRSPVLALKQSAGKFLCSRQKKKNRLLETENLENKKQEAEEDEELEDRWWEKDDIEVEDGVSLRLGAAHSTSSGRKLSGREVYTLAKSCFKRNELAKALSLFDEILTAHTAKFGPEHASVGAALHNIGVVRINSNKFDLAEPVLTEAVRVRKIALGAVHVDVAASEVKLAHAKAQLKKYDEALEIYRDALKIRCEVLGRNHPSVAKLKCQIGLLYFEAGESLAAQAAFEDALSIYTTNKKLDDQNHMRGEQTTIILRETNDYALQETLFNLGTIQLKRRNFDQAIMSLEKALEIQHKLFGITHPTPLDTWDSLAFAYSKLQKFEKSMEESSLPSIHPSVIKTKSAIARVEKTKMSLPVC